MSNDYTPTRLIPIEEFKKAKWKTELAVTTVSETIESEFFDDNFLLRQGDGKESKYLRIYVKNKHVVGFTRGGDPTGNQLLEIIQKTFNVKLVDCSYDLQHCL